MKIATKFILLALIASAPMHASWEEDVHIAAQNLIFFFFGESSSNHAPSQNYKPAPNSQTNNKQSVPGNQGDKYYSGRQMEEYVGQLCANYNAGFAGFSKPQNTKIIVDSLKRDYAIHTNGPAEFSKDRIDEVVNSNLVDFIESHYEKSCTDNYGVNKGKCKHIAVAMRNTALELILKKSTIDGNQLAQDTNNVFAKKIQSALSEEDSSYRPSSSKPVEPAYNPEWTSNNNVQGYSPSAPPAYNPYGNEDEKPAVINPNWDGSNYMPQSVDPNVAPEFRTPEWIKQQKEKFGVPANKKLIMDIKCIWCHEKFDHEKLQEDEEAVERVFLTCGHDMCADCKEDWKNSREHGKNCPHGNVPPSECNKARH
jgi:hypothetical protein